MRSEALACCHLCDHLGLLVSYTIITTFPKTFIAKYEPVNPFFALSPLPGLQARVLLSYHTAKYGHEVGPQNFDACVL